METAALLSMPPIAEEEVQAFDLRPYQVQTVEGGRQGLRDGHKRQIFCSPTGSGKTIIAGHLIKEALAKGSHVLFIVDRIALVRQTRERFSEMGISCGVMQGKNTWGRYEKVQICSAQTLERRDRWPKADLVIVDEAHSVRKATRTFIEALEVPVIGLTATPFTKGLGLTYSHVVNTCTTNNLLEWLDPATGRPYLAPLKVYAAAEINMAGAKTDKGGEWLGSEVEQRGTVILGDAVTEWQEKTALHFGGPVKTLVRSATIAHGKEICRAFQAAGYDFRQSTYLSNGEDDEQMIEDFRRGRFTGLVSVDKFNKGFDVPDILCLVDQRPLRKSLASEVQFLGRGMRASPGKDFVLVLDHTANYLGFMQQIGDFFTNGVHTLDEGTKRAATPREEVKEREGLVCKCGFVLEPGMQECPSCGRIRPPRKSTVNVRPGKMREVGEAGAWKYDRWWTWRQICGVAIDRKAGDFEAARRFALAQYKNLIGEWPPRDWDFDPEEYPHRMVKAKVRQQLTAYFKSR